MACEQLRNEKCGTKETGMRSLPKINSTMFDQGLHNSIGLYIIIQSRPIYIGKTQNPKNLGFLLYRLHCQKNP